MAGVYKYTERNEKGGYIVNASTLSEKELKQAIKAMSGALNKNLRALENTGLANASPFYTKIRGMVEEGSELLTKSVKGDVIFSQSVGGKTKSQLRAQYMELRHYMGMETRKYSVLADAYPDFVKRYKDPKTGKVSYVVENERIERMRQMVESNLYMQYVILYDSDNARNYFQVEAPKHGYTFGQAETALTGEHPWTHQILGSSIAIYTRATAPGEEVFLNRLSDWQPEDASPEQHEQNDNMMNSLQSLLNN